RQKFAQSIGLPFADVLSESDIESALEDEGVTYRKRLFCPIVTLWAWISQVLDKDKSCKKAVSRVISYLVAEGMTPPSTDTGAYCKARARLKERMLLGLMRLTGKHSHEQPEEEFLWCGRRVAVFDGSSLTMADTEKNQKKYPQPTSPALGCGFPAGRIVCGFSLATGAVLDAVISPLSVGEVNLFRQLYVHLQASDVALGDRIFGTFADICLLFARGVDSAFRVHGARKTDFRKGKRLARWDHIVEWVKPKQCPRGLKKKLFDQLPQRILLREVRFHIPIKGFRTEDVTLVTTLLDPKEYTRIDLAELYRLRWHAEIDLKHLKTTMQMEHLPSKTPEMVRKDFYVHLLAYNLIRTVQLEASRQQKVDPLALSFCATIQHLSNFACLLAHATEEQREYEYSQLIYLVSTEKLPFRPNRVEPRAVKRRPKAYPRLTKPRKQLKRKLVNDRYFPRAAA
ncbi:IS4 family transposase, partial [Candidatus Poribacteria bacterium]|nr:IS4 family transposase [Candidatus Poribacteria bacterium]